MGDGVTRSTSVLIVAALVGLLLAVSVARQYRWVTDLSGLQQDQADRALQLSTDTFIRQANREIEALWYVFHVRDGFEPAEEIGADFGHWAESASHPDLVAAAFWIADRARRGEPATPADRFALETIALPDGAFAPAPADASLLDLAASLAERPRSRRRSFSPRDGFLATLDDGRQAFVIPQPAMRTPAWAVAVLSPSALGDGLLATLVREHFGADDQREFEVQVSRGAADGPVIFASAAGGAPGRWSESDAASEGPYLTATVRHRDGSIAIAAATVRRGNLLFTFGTVAVLLAALVTLAIGTRRAQRLVQRQTEFVAGVSHELRTPISGISAMSQNLADGVIDDPAQAAVYGRSIQQESRRLNEMVEGVLQLSAIRSGGFPYRFSAIDVADVVAESVAALDADARSSVHVDVSDDCPLVRADGRALGIVVRNLVSNALKFGGSTPDVRVTLEPSTWRGRPAVRLTVRDSGCGIDAADRRHVFEPFYRGRAAHDAQTPGSGLGLSVVRQVVAAHGGRVDVSSTPGEGSTFTVTLPAPTAERAPARAGAPA